MLFLRAWPSGTMQTMRMRMKATQSSDVFIDERGAERVLRVSWHPEHRMTVLSMWRGDQCVSTFRMPAGEVPALVNTLTSGLADLATVTANTDYRDEVATALLERSATTPEPPVAPEPPAPRRTEPWTQIAARGLNMLIDGCTRLRDKLNQR